MSALNAISTDFVSKDCPVSNVAQGRAIPKIAIASESSNNDKDTFTDLSIQSEFELIIKNLSDRPVFFYDRVKRAVDVFCAGLLLTLLSPLMLLIIFLIRITSKGPAIFCQKRLTKGGRVFEMYKFRTMCVNAESTTGAVWASFSDPRVTKVGRILRVTRLDELPQLVNVIKGDMSLIGPRPERPEIAVKLAKELPLFGRRMEVRAGITGLSQIAAGYASSVRSYRRKLALDLKYIEKRCFLLDLNIALKTIVVVLTGAGAR